MCSERKQDFPSGEDDFKQKFWGEPPFLSHFASGGVFLVCGQGSCGCLPPVRQGIVNRRKVQGRAGLGHPYPAWIQRFRFYRQNPVRGRERRRMRVVRRTHDGGCSRLSARRRLPAVPGLSFQRRERALSFYFPICRTARIPSVFSSSVCLPFLPERRATNQEHTDGLS